MRGIDHFDAMARRKASLPPKLTVSLMTTRGILNCTIVPAHIMQGVSEV